MSKKKSTRTARVLALQKVAREAWGATVAKRLLDKGVSQAHIAKLAETTESGLSRVIHALENTSIDRMAQTAEALGARIVGFILEDID